MSDRLPSLQHKAFSYFLHETNPANGLVRDKTADDWPASIAATGLALAAYPVGVERGLLTRALALERTLAALRFFADEPARPRARRDRLPGLLLPLPRHAHSGRRAWQCELSTVDTAPPAGGRADRRRRISSGATADEREIRALADALYARADWQWAQNGGATVTHGWKPESGFLHYRWEGYDEALILYVLGLGSPTHPLPAESYAAWASTYEWKTIYGIELLYAGPLFTHQLSHVWIDFRGIRRRRSCAIKRDRLFREQPPRHPCPAALRDRQSARLRAVRRKLLGDHRQRRTRPETVMSTASSASSSTTWRAACRTDRTTARSRRGPCWPRCRSPRRSCCRRSTLAASCTARGATRTDSKPPSTRPSRRHSGHPHGWVSPCHYRHQPGADRDDDRESPDRFRSGA